jgi:hypothetical protein
MEARDFTDTFVRHWWRWVLLFWVGAMAWMVWDRWGAIRIFGLGDTDDNMRIMQVRAWLAGQGWFDLRQYRLDPPYGADIHWSRLVDLPLAAIKLGLTPFLGGRLAETIAVAAAPMVPMLVAMFALAAIARRAIAPKALVLALGMLLCAHATRLMWAPMRIDHHGWQLAFLALVMMALVDRERARGGVLLGLATAGSLAIGLEMLVYLAAAGALVVLMWVRDRDESQRLLAYGVSLAGGSAVAFLIFASYANRAPVCDALSPVWLSAVTAGGALCAALALMRPANPWIRFAAAAAGGLLIAIGFAWAWPHCLGRLEGVSPEAQRLWLSHVREARPIYRQSTLTMISFATLPAIGLCGYAAMLWRHRRSAELLIPWIALATLALISVILLLWQTRAGPAAQLLAVPGTAGIAWLVLTWLLASRHVIVRVLGTSVGFLLISGIAIQITAAAVFKGEDTGANRKKITLANRRCPTMAALRPIALLPRGYVLTLIDLGPRLITVTHHDAVAGPYHRNDDAIVDVMHAFRGSADNARAMIRRRGINYVLICPNFSESTNYQVEAPNGFYAQLNKGKVPDWLMPVPLPADSPFKMWRVK